VRHGHTTANGGGTTMRLSGWTDVPLSEAGLRDVAIAADRLRCFPFSSVYVSPLRRALQTAQRLERAPGTPFVIDPDLREIWCGEADGRSIEDVRVSFPKHWERNERQDDDDFRWPGGESYREFRCRCIRAVTRIAVRHLGSSVAVFTHAGVITQILGSILGFRPARWEAYRAGNGTITSVDWTGDGGRLVAFADGCHRNATFDTVGAGAGERTTR
jgi:broad specificity phosphatase PhoE